MKIIRKCIMVFYILAVIYCIARIWIDDEPRIGIYVGLLVFEGIAVLYQYIKNGRKLYKKTEQEIENLIDMGEGLNNFISAIYIPSIYLCYNQEWLTNQSRICIVIALSVMIAYLNIQIYRYKKTLRLKRK